MASPALLPHFHWPAALSREHRIVSAGEVGRIRSRLRTWLTSFKQFADLRTKFLASKGKRTLIWNCILSDSRTEWNLEMHVSRPAEFSTAGDIHWWLKRLGKVFNKRSNSDTKSTLAICLALRSAEIVQSEIPVSNRYCFNSTKWWALGKLEKRPNCYENPLSSADVEFTTISLITNYLMQNPSLQTTNRTIAFDEVSKEVIKNVLIVGHGANLTASIIMRLLDLPNIFIPWDGGLMLASPFWNRRFDSFKVTC